MVEMMSADGLEAGSAQEFEERWWRFERVVYAVVTLILLAAIAGLFGRGPVSKATAGTRGGPLWVEYERFARFRTPTMMVVHVGASAAANGDVAVRLIGPVNQRIPISRVVPQPTSAAPIADGQLYTFRLAS